MSRKVVNLTLDLLTDLPSPCGSCVFWELDPVAGTRAVESGDPGLEKEAWVSATLLEWGSCGKLAYVDEAPAGYVLYAPPAYVPRSMAFPTAPVSSDAVLLMTARVIPEFEGSGLGRMLIQTVAKDLLRHNVRALEAYGDAQPPADGSRTCLVPADYLLSIGFKTVRPHPGSHGCASTCAPC